MFLDLHEIIEAPGGRVSFRCELSQERLVFPALAACHGPVSAEGEVRNTAGILELDAVVEADMTVRCDRCSTEFPKHITLPVKAVLKADPDEDDYEDMFPLDGDGIDAADVMETCFILGMDQKFLCREDCKGLCPECGRNLNDGPCGCKKKTDPRMAALAQLLDDIQEV